jgi:hypothetical protein
MKKMKMMFNKDMNEEELNMLRERTEHEFFRMLDEGKDIRTFLYFPEMFLSKNVKKYLDNFLIEEAYEQINTNFSEFVKNFIVYDDTLIKIKIDEREKRLELLDRMIKYFISKEEYEKCSTISNVRDHI